MPGREQGKGERGTGLLLGFRGSPERERNAREAAAGAPIWEDAGRGRRRGSADEDEKGVGDGEEIAAAPGFLLVYDWANNWTGLGRRKKMDWAGHFSQTSHTFALFSFLI